MKENIFCQCKTKCKKNIFLTLWIPLSEVQNHRSYANKSILNQSICIIHVLNYSLQIYNKYTYFRNGSSKLKTYLSARINGKRGSLVAKGVRTMLSQESVQQQVLWNFIHIVPESVIDRLPVVASGVTLVFVADTINATSLRYWVWNQYFVIYIHEFMTIFC